MLYHRYQYLKDNGYPSAIVCISFFTDGWMQSHLTTCWKLFSKDIPILVVDNNPDVHEDNYKKNTSTWSIKFKHNPTIDAERWWLGVQQRNGCNLVVVKQPDRYNLTHGSGIDCAKQWCLEHGFNTITHIEPDICFDNTRWYMDQVQAISQGMWVAGCHRRGLGVLKRDTPPNIVAQELEKAPLHVCCTTYYLPPLAEYSFKVVPVGDDKKCDNISEIVSEYHGSVWDTGDKVWFEAAKLNKYVQTNAHGTWHIWNSSLNDFWSRERHEYARPSH